MKNTCKACLYWCGRSNYKAGDCRRYPPHITGWPQTRPDDWCGEFQNNIQTTLNQVTAGFRKKPEAVT